MKKCNKCLVEKDDNDFPPRGNTIGFLCRICKREYDKEYYHRNKEEQRVCKRKARNKWGNKRKDFLHKIKSVPCKDCNIQFKPWQMQFDHLKDKLFNISGLGRQVSEKVLLDEIKKCDIVCANCHADRTYKRFNN